MNKCCFPKSSIYFLITLNVLCVVGCRPIDVGTTLINEWYTTRNETPLAHTGGEGPVSIFRFYEGGKYSQFGTDNYSFGVWGYKKADSILYLHPYQGSTEILDSYYYVNKVTEGSMYLTLYRNLPIKPGHEELLLTMKAGPGNADKNDPYPPELHTWRIKPMHPETDTQIFNRAKSYLLFLRIMYRHAISNEMESMPVNWYPHPLRMHYGNGVRMAYNDELNDWYSCFYDTAQAAKGYFCISNPLRNVTIKSTENKFVRNLDCVEQLLKQMK